jgi:hypothetical protein
MRERQIRARAMAHAASDQPFTAEDRVHARASPCGICGRQRCTGSSFSQSSSGFCCHCDSIVDLRSYISSRKWIICPLEPAVQRHSLTPST